jgi:predicted nucleic acid-binding protein
VRVLVDSSVWIDYFNGVDTPQTDYLDAILGRAPVVVGDLIVTEVLQGLADEREVALAQAALAKFDSYGLAGSEIAVAAAVNRRLLRAQGQPPGDALRALIATFCIRFHFALLHSDRRFKAYERHLGLKVPDPGM